MDINGHKKILFTHKILFVGFGAVARCTLPILLKHVVVPPSNITILDLVDRSNYLTDYIAQGINFHVVKITKENITATLDKYLSEGDILIDLAYEIDTLTFLKYCHEHSIMYINASVEEWDPYGKHSVYEETLYYRHMRIRETTSKWIDPVTKHKIGATAIMDHGANPGLISHFVKRAIVDIATRSIKEGKLDPETAKEISSYLDKISMKSEIKNSFAHLAMLLGIKVIHCSERDTQTTNNPKQVAEFVNTWSVEGFYEEGIAPAEMGWGTHERTIPENGVFPPEGPMNQLFLAQSGMNTWVRSFVPNANQIVGMVIRHGEAFTISEYLSVNDANKTIYRPTVHYAYNPCDLAIASLQELRGRDNELQPKIRILEDKEITGGADILGALVMGHNYNSWWTGSELQIEEARKLAPGQNSTTVQVAAGMLGAIMWMIEHPNEGVCVPDDIPYDYVLDFAKPYLGNFISQAYDWTPLKTRNDPFERKGLSNDPWQFSSFLYSL